MKRQKGSLLQRAMAMLLSAVLVVGMTANAVPMYVFAQENVEGQDEKADTVTDGGNMTGDPVGMPGGNEPGDPTGTPDENGTGDLRERRMEMNRETRQERRTEMNREIRQTFRIKICRGRMIPW